MKTSVKFIQLLTVNKTMRRTRNSLPNIVYINLFKSPINLTINGTGYQTGSVTGHQKSSHNHKESSNVVKERKFQLRQKKILPELDKNDDGTARWYRTLLNAGKFFPRFSGSTRESLVGTRVRHGPVIAGEKAHQGTVRSRFVGVPSMYYI